MSDPVSNVAKLSREKITILLCYVAMMAMAISINLIPILLTTLSVDLGGLNHEQLGRMGAATFAGIVIGIACTGPLVDRWGARYFAVGGNASFAAGLALFGTATSYPIVLLAAFAMGAGAGILDMILSPLICALQPERKASALNWLHSFYCVGAVLTVLAASSLLQAGVGWRSMALALTAIPLVLLVAFACAYIPPLIGETQRPASVRELCRNSSFLALVGAIFLSGGSELGLSQWLPAYAEDSLGFSRWTSGMALLAFSLAMALGRMLAAWAGTRVQPANLMVKSGGLCVVLFLLGCLLPWPAAGLIACVLVGFAVSPFWPTTLGIVGDRFPSGGASMFGLLTAAGNFGGMVMPWVVGVIADRASMRLGLASVALCPLIIIVLINRVSRTDALPEFAPAAPVTAATGQD